MDGVRHERRDLSPPPFQRKSFVLASSGSLPATLEIMQH